MGEPPVGGQDGQWRGYGGGMAGDAVSMRACMPILPPDMSPAMASGSAVMRSFCAMDPYTLWALLLSGLAGVSGWTMLAAARGRRARADALARQAGSIPAALIVPLHDHLLDTALAHYGERELRAGRTLLEFAIAVQDRHHELAGHAHGPLNRARIRSRLLPAAHRLRGDPNPFRVREFRETFLLALDGQRDPDQLEPLVLAFRQVHAGKTPTA